MARRHLAGRGVANPSSMRAALELAKRLAARGRKKVRRKKEEGEEMRLSGEATSNRALQPGRDALRVFAALRRGKPARSPVSLCECPCI